MHGDEHTTLAARLHRQAAAVSESWQRALAGTGFTAFDSGEVRRQLALLTDELLTLLLEEALPPTRAQEIGAAVARLHFVQPDALGQTQAVLAQHLLPELQGDSRGGMAIRLLLLLSEMGTGFSRQVRALLLAEQDSIRAASLRELQQAGATLTQQYALAEQARSELRAVLDAADDGMLLLSLERRALAVNRRLEELLGVPAAAILGRQLADLQEALEPVFADFPAVRRTMAEIANSEQQATVVLRQRWPAERELQVFSTPVRRTDGAILGRLHTFRDVTEERAVQRLKDEFVALVSHELRTPLTSIKGYIDLLLDGEVGELMADQREFLEIIQRNATREVTLVNDLLDLSRLETGELELPLAPLALAALLADVVASLRPACDGKGQQVALETPANLPPVRGNADRLTQVFTNLLSNAHKYTPVGGQITITSSCTPLAVRVAVQDTGIGLSRHEQMQLFTKFFRARHPAVHEVAGTGLGLVITRTLVERHGGELVVESAPGRGSTFTVILPRADRPADPGGDPACA